MKRILAVAGLLACACSPTQGDGVREAVVADSAGVPVVTFPELPTAQRDLTELLRIGSLDGDEATVFGNVVGGQILEDGGIVIADRQALEVRRFSPDGSHLGSHGREGEGPGEYRYIVGIGNCTPEGFTVFDISWVLSLYGPDGAFREEVLFRLNDGSSPYSFACSRSGHVAVTNWDRSRSARGPTLGSHTAWARLRLMNLDGVELQDLGRRIGSERFGFASGSGPHPIGRSTHVGFMGPDLIVSDGRMFGFIRPTRSRSRTSSRNVSVMAGPCRRRHARG